MSGLEVAGVVLGIVPLMILAFEGYVRIREDISDFANFDQKLRALQRTLGITEALFKAEVKAILSDVIEEDRRNIMLEDFRSPYWGDSEDNRNILKDEIRASLGDLYKPIVDLIRSANEITDLVKKNLDSGQEMWEAKEA